MKLVFVAAASAAASAAPFAAAFAPIARRPLLRSPSSSTRMMMVFDPLSIADAASSSAAAASAAVMGTDGLMMDVANTASATSSSLLAFADQGQNLAGIFFQLSLLPYLIFLYFLSFRGNRVPSLGNFGWQYLLLFVLSTIPGGLISKSQYGVPLADCDWLHGSAEALLTVCNVLIVLGFRDAMVNAGADGANKKPERDRLKLIAGGCFALFVAAAAVGPGVLGFEAHSPFLLGVGDLPTDMATNLPWVLHTEPINALSIPTWSIHFSSVYEFLFAMNIIWTFSAATQNPKWKGLTWGMLPLHASGIAACTYHFFYNPSSLQFLVTTQAGLTLLGNITIAIAAFRIAVSNGWTVADLNPFPQSKTSPRGIVVDNLAATPLTPVMEYTDTTETDAVLAAKLAGLTIVTAYLIKYGELGLDLPFTASAPAAVGLVCGIPALTAYQYYSRSQREGGEFAFPGFGGGDDGKKGGGLSMEDVKKYGVAGTIAYILTELAFWAVAFPVASTTYYKTAGHWPDVLNDPSDRATVLGFIFAGANVARLLVPLRLGAALALAPWVDENILGGDGLGKGEGEEVGAEEMEEEENAVVDAVATGRGG